MLMGDSEALYLLWWSNMRPVLALLWDVWNSSSVLLPLKMDLLQA